MTAWPARRVAWSVLGIALLATLMPAVRAQSPDVQLAPSRVVGCMTPPVAQRGEPEYPFAPWKRREGGRVLVELTFAGADLEPEVKVLDSQGDEAMVSAVKAHVARFRTPCAEAAELPVRLRQDYVFTPDKRKVAWTIPADAADPARRRVLKCLVPPEGSRATDYPLWARRQQVQGNVLARMRFTAPDRPPEVSVYAASRGMKRMAELTIRPWVEQWRLPCIEGAAVETLVTFVFRLDKDVFGFKSMSFLQFLRMAKNLEQPGAAFDTRTMGCPFDVRLNYLQPHFPNSVGQVGEPEPQPARQALLDWLSTLELNLAVNQQDAVLGDAVTLTVPCAKIDLNPKEKTS